MAEESFLSQFRYNKGYQPPSKVKFVLSEEKCIELRLFPRDKNLLTITNGPQEGQKMSINYASLDHHARSLEWIKKYSIYREKVINKLIQMEEGKMNGEEWKDVAEGELFDLFRANVMYMQWVRLNVPKRTMLYKYMEKVAEEERHLSAVLDRSGPPEKHKKYLITNADVMQAVCAHLSIHMEKVKEQSQLARDFPIPSSQ